MVPQVILLGQLLVTAYRATPAQTKPTCVNRYHCTTATGDNVSETEIAVSQDLLRSGKVHYGDAVYVEGVGFRVVADTMAGWHMNAADVFVYTVQEERRIGVHHRYVWLITRH